MKIFAVGMNYAEHISELHKDEKIENEEPVIFMKPDSSLLKDSKPFFMPDFMGRIDYETEIVVRICRLGKSISERFASRYYDAITVGCDFTARDVQKKARLKGNPWLISKGFDGASTIGEFIPKERFEDIQDIPFRLDIDGRTVQSGNTRDMIFKVDSIVSYISQFITLKMGDLIFTGTPSGIGPVHPDEHLQGFIGEEKVLDFYVR